MAEKSNRSVRFAAWLESLDEEKISLLVDLERNARLIAHVRLLTGDADPKLVDSMVRVSRKIQEKYEG